ncbi:T9SS type A sorting domain-containing protein [Pontibacter qinzhouensis]|uniref:T9SS type A sorting domain-containing protein n=1 Tax=Pontibacter qinzhouensis TaxID=2603253 RepID=A0A5C8K6I6_9BACT|nr:T9SS type A sorting domain-containing protein [Pontibacter qinzhouensis]TXK44656.1 T9SS type A sorting domain-containing protein [Pontibacter qinzhouensis]
MMTNLRSFFLSAFFVLLFLAGFATVSNGQVVHTTLKDRTFNVREQVTFDVVTAQGPAPANTNVKLRFTLMGTNATLLGSKIQMQYMQGSDWVNLPFTDGVATFGPEAGFPLADATRQFRATFEAAGNLGYRIEIVPAAGGAALAGADETFNVNAISSPTVNSTLDNYPAGELTSGRDTEFDVFYSAGDRTADLVYLRYVFTNPAQRDKVRLYIAPDPEGTPPAFMALTKDDQGNFLYAPEGGFLLTGTSTSQANLLMRINFAEAGTYEYKVDLVHATNGVVVATVLENVTVTQGATISSTLHNMQNIVKGTATDFTVAITEGVTADGPVRIRFTLADPEQAANVMLMAETGTAGEYETLTLQDGALWYGPEAGLPLKDATFKFRVQFAEAGNYAYTIQLIKMTSNRRVLAMADEMVEVLTVTSAKDKIENSQIVAYPTVSNGSVRVDLGSVRDAQIAVVDMLGKTVLTIDRANGSAEINTLRLANGIYFIRVMKGNEVAVSRFVVR